MTIGKKDGIGIKELISFIYETSGIQGRDIGDITFLEKFSFVNIPSVSAADFLESVGKSKFKGRKIHVEVANKRMN